MPGSCLLYTSGADIAVYISVCRKDAAAFDIFTVGNHMIDGSLHISGILETGHLIILAFAVVDNIAHPLILVCLLYTSLRRSARISLWL